MVSALAARSLARSLTALAAALTHSLTLLASSSFFIGVLESTDEPLPPLLSSPLHSSPHCVFFMHLINLLPLSERAARAQEDSARGRVRAAAAAFPSCACHLHSLVTAPHSSAPSLRPSLHPSIPFAARCPRVAAPRLRCTRRWFGNGVSLVGPPRDRGSCSHPLLTQSVTHFAFAAIVDFQPRTAGKTEPSRFRRRSFWSYITTATDGRRRRRSRSRPLDAVRARRHLLSSGEGRVSVGACRRWQLPGRRSSSSSSSSTVAAGAALHSHE